MRNIIPKRRAEFPSWSWTGWEGTVVFPEQFLDVAAEHDNNAMWEIDLEARLLGDVIEDEIKLELEVWVVEIDIRRGPFSEIFIPGVDESIAVVKEGEALHNDTLRAGSYTCFVIQRHCERVHDGVWARERVFLLSIERTDHLARRRALLTAALSPEYSFDLIKREKQVICLI